MPTYVAVFDVGAQFAPEADVIARDEVQAIGTELGRHLERDRRCALDHRCSTLTASTTRSTAYSLSLSLSH